MDEVEVERLAKLMHEVHREFVNGRSREDDDPRTPIGPWGGTTERYKQRIRHVARAVLADLVPQPIVVKGGELP